MGDETPLQTLADTPGLTEVQRVQVASGTARALLQE
jgi:hypothetical protein